MKTNEVEFINTITVSPILNTYKSEPKMKNELTENDFLGLVVFHRKVKILNIINLIAKRIIDIIGAIVGIILMIPITIGIAITKTVLKDKGPIFYSHTRIGKNGKQLKNYKMIQE